jgi:hypothetical protein
MSDDHSHLARNLSQSGYCGFKAFLTPRHRVIIKRRYF